MFSAYAVLHNHSLWLARKRLLLFSMSNLNLKASGRANDEELLIPAKGKRRRLGIQGEDVEIFALPVHFSLYPWVSIEDDVP